MRSIRWIILVVFIYFSITIALQCQEKPEGWVRPPGEIVDLHILRYQANSNDPEQKMLALKRIEYHIDNDTLDSSDNSHLLVLESLALGGSKQRIITSDGIETSNPEIKRYACSLLGRVGGKKSENILMKVLRDEDDAVVLSEAIVALSVLKVDTDKEFCETLASKIITQHSKYPDSGFAINVLNALDRLHRSGHNLEDPVLFRSLLLFLDGMYSADVRDKTMDLVEKLLG